ncbi:hypothetical protein FAZ95_37230 [Trinickia violacea]|uniref:Uncharacterized protein n=1 Tax=Trinickia violacea TaxID=2571746 RepID=A0A4V1EIP9_9BURK|nr:hypothetical protein [Trinickia violacea]QCP54530.1 hypothetical protein FAZ95_37230 [Trinickia violacea]
MEHLIRILNDDDRQTLAWLRKHVGDSCVADAACRLAAQRGTSAGALTKPYVSAICRYLGVWPPTPHWQCSANANHAIADQHLAQMRQLLARCTTPARRTG